MLIPEDLVALTGERRIIPFLGAGFSDTLGLPSWETMLRGLCARIEGSLPYDELSKATGGDFLQIAEYLYLKSDRRIGPLRRQIDRVMSPTRPLITSGPHMELVNLGAQQIYTTNYDDLVETLYRELGLPFDVIVLPKDIALADPKRTQIVKFHGDLEHEETLVLTESNYYRRLDFDSPMDLKFRSDLLGKSVLFMGYSFRDVNIRVIWFKLMDMMRDIPEGERRASYIVRLNANPVLEELYAAVGLKTIVLSPDREVVTPQESTKLLGEFLLRLSGKAETAPVSVDDAHGRGPIFASEALISDDLGVKRVRREELGARRMYYGGFMPVSHPRVSRLLSATAPGILEASRAEAVAKIIPELDLNTLPDLLKVASVSAPSADLTAAVVRILASQGGAPPRALRRDLIARFEDWSKVWSQCLPDDFSHLLLDRAIHEFMAQADVDADEDGAFYVDLTARLANGSLNTDPDIMKVAEKIMLQAAAIYPSARNYKPPMDGPPDLDGLLQEVSDRSENFQPVDYAQLLELSRLRSVAAPPKRGVGSPTRTARSKANVAASRVVEGPPASKRAASKAGLPGHRRQPVDDPSTGADAESGEPEPTP